MSDHNHSRLRLNPHGGSAPCTTYCRGDMHAILLLGNRWNHEGRPMTAEDFMAGIRAYYQQLGWAITRGRPAETSPEHVLAMMEADPPGNAAQIMRGATQETPPPPTAVILANYTPWLLIVTPLTEEP